MKCSEIIRSLNRLAPETHALEWDNSGFLCGDPEREVTKVLLALDATDEVVQQAVEEGAHMLITHHPLMFHPIKKVTSQDFLGRRLISLIKADVSYYAAHTNYDVASGCMADLAAERMELLDGMPLLVTGEEAGISFGVGKIGSLPKPMTVVQVAEQVKARFRLPFVAVYDTRQNHALVSRIAISPGAGGSMIQPALDGMAEVLVSGDISHHEGIDAVASHMAVIDAGHYGLEYIFMDHVGQYLGKEFGSALEIVKAELSFPVTVV